MPNKPEDNRWRHGQIYVFVNITGEAGGGARVPVFPPDRSREGLWGPTVDSFGTNVFMNQHRTLSLVPEAWVYYSYINPATGLEEPKRSYVKSIDWNGGNAVAGAGFHARDLPGTCHAAHVNAAALEAAPSNEGLQEFVRCAANTVESSGYYAAPVLTQNERWNHGSVYVFGVDLDGAAVLFSGSPASFRRVGEHLEPFGGRDMGSVIATFGEVFLYYRFIDPATGSQRPKMALARLVGGLPVFVVSGYNP